MLENLLPLLLLATGVFGLLWLTRYAWHAFRDITASPHSKR